MTPREQDRQEILDAVRIFIEQGMNSGSAGHHIKLARAYGQTYKVIELIEDWLLSSRRMFLDSEHAWQWAETLP
jgi:hypothetical protein